MEIDITKFFETCAPMDYSASVAEIGDNAGSYTWNAAKDDASDNSDLLDTDEKRNAFKEYVSEFGAWSEEEINAWSNEELTALFMQVISGDMREGGLVPGMSEEDWQEYEKQSEAGRISGRIFKGIDGKIYYCIGN